MNAHKVTKMLFITLAKFRKKPTKVMIAETTKLMEQGLKEAICPGSVQTDTL